MHSTRMFVTLFSFAMIVAAAPVLGQEEKLEGCTVMICGKATTVDGSIIFVKTEDDSPREIDYLWHVPRKKHAPGAVVQLERGGQLPQVAETYAFFWDQCPTTSFSNCIINEWGVSFGSNACGSKEDSVAELEQRGELVKGGLGFKFRMLLAERAKSAREAVLLAAELIGKYGYSGSGRNLNIVGHNEAWQLQLVRGKHYVARRVQDDEVAIIANTFSIREVDLDDRENFICSPDLVEYAVKRGWHDPARDGAFDFAKAYAPARTHTSKGNVYRQWNMARQLNKDLGISWKEAEQGILPVAVKPDRKLSLAEAMSIFRNHYEGTELDRSDNYRLSPHKTASTICNYGTHRTTVIQQRSWLPPAIGTVCWRSLDQPCSSVFIPWYLGATNIPDSLQKAPERLGDAKRDLLDFHFNMPEEAWRLDLESASSVFRLLGKLVDADYQRAIGRVQPKWRAFEEQEFALQPTIEVAALKLYQQDPQLAHEFLNRYSGAQAQKALEAAKEMIDDLLFSF